MTVVHKPDVQTEDTQVHTTGFQVSDLFLYSKPSRYEPWWQIDPPAL